MKLETLNSEPLSALAKMCGVEVMRDRDGMYAKRELDGTIGVRVRLPWRYTRLQLDMESIEAVLGSDYIVKQFETAADGLRREQLAALLDDQQLQSVAVQMLEKRGWRYGFARDVDIAQGNHD